MVIGLASDGRTIETTITHFFTAGSRIFMLSRLLCLLQSVIKWDLLPLCTIIFIMGKNKQDILECDALSCRR